MPDSEPQRRAFISYCHANREIAIAVQAAIEAAGWAAFRDETDLQPGAPLPASLATAIDEADVFVAIISDAYNQSAPCLWELNQAVARKFGDNPLRVVGLRVGGAEVPALIRGDLWVALEPGSESAAVAQALRTQRLALLTESAARELTDQPSADPEPTQPTQRDLVREAVRYARELEALAEIDASLVEAQHAIERVARSYDEAGYSEAYRLWQEAWVRKSASLTDAVLLGRLQAVGSLIAEVVLSDRTPRQLRPWMVQRAITSVRAAVGFALRGEPLPDPTFPDTSELRQLLGQGDGEDDPFGPLRARLQELGTPQFHPEQ